MKKPVKKIPYLFVLENLASAEPYTKPMFGCTAVYVGEKIVFILRKKDDGSRDTGIWLATTVEHHTSLQKIFPHMRSLEMFGPGPTGWQVLPEDAPDFEESVNVACELVLKNDSRIGKVPKRKAPKKKVSKRKKNKQKNIRRKVF